MWLPLHDKQPRPSPCGEGHCVPAELEDRARNEERSSFSLQCLLQSKAKFPVPQQWRTAPVVCGFTMKSLSWTNLSMHGGVRRSPALNLKIRIQNFSSNFRFHFCSLFFSHRFTCGLFILCFGMVKVEHHSQLFSFHY